MSIRKKIFVFSTLLACVLFLFSCVTTGGSAKSKKASPEVKFGENLNAALASGDYEKALALFDNLDPELEKNEDIKVLKFSILISADKIKEAKAYANVLEKEFPDNLDVLYSQFMMADAENNTKKKVKYLKKIIAKNPKDSRALTALATNYYDKKNYRDARRNYIKAYKADKNCTEALIGLGKINYMENKLEQAERNLKAALKKDPNNAVAIAELARVESETDRLFDALKHIKKATELDPKNHSHWMDLGTYTMQVGRKKEARKAYSKVIELMPDYYVAYIYRAGLNDELGYKNEALEDYKKVCQLYPSYYFAWEGAGVLFWERKDWRNAKYAFINALKRSPSSYQYAILTALCDHKMGKGFEAKKFMKEYLKTINRSKKENEYFTCRLFVDFSGDTDLLNRAAREKDSTKKGRMYFYIGEFYKLKKKPTLAVKCYEEVLSVEAPGFFEYRLADGVMKGSKK